MQPFVEYKVQWGYKCATSWTYKYYSYW